MADEAHNATDAETAYRQHRRRLPEELQVGSLPSAKLRSPGIPDQSHELGFRKRFGFVISSLGCKNILFCRPAVCTSLAYLIRRLAT